MSSDTELEFMVASWSQQQLEMKSKLVVTNTERWQEERKLTYVGGFDLSFCKSDSSVACCTVVVCDVSQQLQVVYEDSRQVFLFDGNGILHPRGLGLASHFGVYTNTCTIGVAKNLYQMDNVLRDDNHLAKINSLTAAGEHFFIENLSASGEVLGAALKTTQEAKRPIYVSVGHRIDLECALWTVMQCVQRFRIPEPTRQADIRSRKVVRKLDGMDTPVNLNKTA
ncbi:hypothetical protein OUZ56_030232 [Daphnia magna]|uniref:Endonuclease V n=1 Tax=Daphnia magna TaxID=35525 RepID=A0ABQ9ZRZ0_9CRUS|nr:hypothetical protein OUZ56_030232 [Daphnia magna]